MADLATRVVNTFGHSVIHPRPITGTSGVWTNVTPAGINLDGSAFSGQNFGCDSMLGHPTFPNVAYCFPDFQGCWRTTDYGATWAKYTPDGGPLDDGKNWAAVIAPDASYMLIGGGARSANDFSSYRSVDGGLTWSASAAMVDEPYGFDIDPTNKNHVLVTFHGADNLYESFDGGLTWSDAGSTGGSISGLAKFLDATHILHVGQVGDGTAGTRLGTYSAGSWSWSKKTTREHVHGSSQPFVDTVNGSIFLATMTDTAKSTDGGNTWTQVSATLGSAVTATPSTLYVNLSFPQTALHQQHAPRPAGTSWTDDSGSTPSGLTDGPRQTAVLTDGTRWCIVASCWLAGIWRYIE